MKAVQGPGDMIRDHILTLSGNRPLTSAGMLYLAAYQNGEAIFANKFSPPSFFLPSNRRLNRAQLFTGVHRSSDSALVWDDPTRSSLRTLPMDMIAPCSEYNCDGVTDDCPFFFCKINRFLGFSERPSDAFSAGFEDAELDRQAYCEELIGMMRYYGVQNVAALTKELERPLYQANGLSTHDSLVAFMAVARREDIKVRYKNEEVAFDEIRYYAFQRSEWGWANVDDYLDISGEDRVELQIDWEVADERDGSPRIGKTH